MRQPPVPRHRVDVLGATTHASLGVEVRMDTAEAELTALQSRVGELEAEVLQLRQQLDQTP